MANRKVYSVFDQKAEAFLQPFYSVSHGTAVREFTAAVQTTEHQFQKFSEDYVLFDLGEFDEATGIFSQPDSPIPVLRASAVLENTRATLRNINPIKESDDDQESA